MDSPDRVPVKKLTSDWSEAIDNFSDSETASNIYGKEYRDIYVAIRRNEKDQLAEAISPAEYSAYSGRL
jgi:glutamine synthetase